MLKHVGNLDLNVPINKAKVRDIAQVGIACDIAGSIIKNYHTLITF